MMSNEAARLRAEFDHAFAGATAPPAPFDDALALTLGTDGYAVRLSDLLSLHADRKIVAPFTARPHLLGLAGFRGALVPVFNLRTLLGYPPSTMPRWLVIAKSTKPVAFGFDTFDSYLRTPRSETPPSDAKSPHRHLRGVINGRPLISLSSVLAALEQELHP